MLSAAKRRRIDEAVAGGRAKSGATSFCLCTLPVPGRPLMVTEGPDPVTFLEDSLRRQQEGGEARPPTPATFAAIILGGHVGRKPLPQTSIILASS